MIKTGVLLLLSTLLTACLGVPEGIQTVQHVKAEQYLGTWYEIARMDHSFERGLIKVTADYSLRDDGSIKVINKGFDPKTQKWNEAEGKAYFVDPQNQDGSYSGKLKVSFFGPFYGAYNILVIGKDYQYALVCGPDRSYLWILSRTPTLPKDIQDALINQAKLLGFDTNTLIQVQQ
ncbi:MAG: lipocalin family protein [Methylophilaceae bacterium]